MHKDSFLMLFYEEYLHLEMQGKVSEFMAEFGLFSIKK